MRLLPDTGCPDGLLPSCLSCPLPECRFKLPVKEWNAAVRQVRQRLALAAEQGAEGAAGAGAHLAAATAWRAARARG